MKDRRHQQFEIQRVFRQTTKSASVAALALSSAAAYAQEPPPFVPVEQRQRPEYQSRAINLGAFELIPVISAEMEFVDNLFATQVNPVNDVVARITPTLTVRDRRSDRVLNLRVQAGYESYLDNSVDDRVLLTARGTARFGLGSPTRPFVGFSVIENDTRGRDFADFNETVQPLKLRRYSGNLGIAQDLSDFTITGEGRYDTTEFNGEIILDGQVFDGGLRDFDTIEGRARMAYTRDPKQSFYLEGRFVENDFAGPGNLINLPPNLARDRSSQATNIGVGLTRQLTNVVQLDVNVGYLKQEFSDPNSDSIETVGFGGNLFWNPTRLTSIQASATRDVEQSPDPIFAGLLRTQFALVVQHELRRNLVIGGETLYANIEGGNLTGNGSEFGLSGIVRFFASRSFSLRLRAEYFERSNVFAGDQQRVTLSTRYNF